MYSATGPEFYQSQLFFRFFFVVVFFVHMPSKGLDLTILCESVK